MLKIQDQTGKTVAVLRDEDNEPQLTELKLDKKKEEEEEDDEEAKEKEGK